MKIFLLGITLLLFGCKPELVEPAQPETGWEPESIPEVEGTNFYGLGTTETVWYKGNTHVHTVLCGHADSQPEAVSKWYLDNGYNFLILSEHNRFIDPATVKLPKDRRSDFILVPGQEVTGRRHVHTTAMNIKELVPWKYDHNDLSKVIHSHASGTEKAGGHAILNHPNFHKAVKAEDMQKVKQLQMFELYNGHPTVLSEGDKTKKSTEVMWDIMLSAGKEIYGVSSDDAHQFKKLSPKASNPGRGWVMVNSKGILTSDAVSEAMFNGEFYSSNGVFLKTCKKTHHSYDIEIDDELTRKEISKAHVTGKVVQKGTPEGYLIEFIGDNGKILKSVQGTEASIDIPENVSYVRARVVLTEKNGGKVMQYFAWGQPVFVHHH